MEKGEGTGDLLGARWSAYELRSVVVRDGGSLLNF